MVDINNNITRAEQLIAQNKAKQSRSDELMRKRAAIVGTPEVTNRMARSVSDERRELMELQLEAGEFREQGSGYAPASRGDSPDKIRMIQTQAGIVSGSSLYKMGSGSGNIASSSSGWRGSNDTTRQVPELYSPLWLNSNLNLPRDRPTINAWSRSFFALNPIVHNAISLHSTYPIAKLNIKSKNPQVEKFFSQMIEEIDLMNIAVLAAQEYWILGEAFIYAELDESAGKWSRLMILNPDYVNVQRNVIASEPIISLRPDESLRRVVNSNSPADLQQRKQINPSIIEHVKKNEDIPLNNFYVHHMARRISPYDVRGSGLIVSCFRALMLFDKLRECYDEKTEILTKNGWKNIFDFVKITTNKAENGQYVNGVALDENGAIAGIVSVEDLELACFNPETEELEYHKPEEFHMNHYQGKMFHFSGKKIDSLVTPNHKMWTKKKNHHGGGFGEWQKIPAQEMVKSKTWWKFRSNVKWTGKKIETVEVCGVQIPASLYLEYLGYIVSEGCVYRSYKNGRYDNSISICQLTKDNKHIKFKNAFDKFASLLGKNICEEIKMCGAGYSAHTPKEKWSSIIHGKDIVQYFIDAIGDGESAKSHNKHIPRWVMELCPEQLQILIDALMAGDGSIKESKYNTKSKDFVYNTISKELADDVYEMVFKLGYAPNINVSTARKSDGRMVTEYKVLWSDTVYGKEPNVYSGIRKNTGNGGGAIVTEEDYKGFVWCFTVPTGLFVTRRNGKVTIQGNSKYAQADGMVNPLTLVKIGNQDFRPTPIDLEHWRNVFEECYDEETEVLTNTGFKHFSDVLDYDCSIDQESGKTVYNTTIKQGASAGITSNILKVACFNPETETIEYHEPSRGVLYDFDGDMIKFNSRNMNIKVTPNHDMWVEDSYKKEWKKVKAQKLLSKTLYRTRAVSKYIGNDIKYINILGKEVPIELYLKLLGYLISEGSVESRHYTYTNVNEICFTQSINSDCLEDMSNTIHDFANILDLNVCERTRQPSGDIYKKQQADVVHFHIRNKELVQYFKDQISCTDNCNSKTKKIPRWVLDLKPELLNIILNSLVLGDGYNINNKRSKAFKYFTSSEQLANDVQEIVFKTGYSSNIVKRVREKKYKGKKLGESYISNEYIVSWSTAKDGQYPSTFDKVSKESYKGKVWCLTVPTGLFVTRRNGKITIQGNCQHDKDFKIFTHDAVNVERIGYGQGIYDTSNDIQQLIKEIYIGLMVPSVIMDGSDTTYATGSVALDVLRQRYMQFRQMMTSWLKRKIFAPISQLNDFYEYIDGEKTLIVPDVDWNHMSLFDMDSYINNMVNLSQGEGAQKRVALQTLYRSLGLEYEEEQRKIRYEDIQDAIRTREIAAMQRYSIHELKSLGPGDEIEEVADEPVPGQSPYEPPAGGAGGPGGSSMPGMPPMPGGKPSGAPPSSPIGSGGKPSNPFAP